MAKRGSDRRKQRPATKRHFPRTARLNTLLQEIIADYLDRIDDERLGFLTVTGVEVDADLNRAQVFLSSFADESEDEATLDALQDYRKPVQAEIARSARIRKTPEVVFAFDPAVREGARIESILSSLDTNGATSADGGPPGGATADRPGTTTSADAAPPDAAADPLGTATSADAAPPGTATSADGGPPDAAADPSAPNEGGEGTGGDGATEADDDREREQG